MERRSLKSAGAAIVNGSLLCVYVMAVGFYGPGNSQRLRCLDCGSSAARIACNFLYAASRLARIAGIVDESAPVQSREAGVSSS